MQQDMRERWKRRTATDRHRTLWDHEAPAHARRPLPSFASDGFLQHLEQHGLLHEDMSVLDIGCGAGGYALALAGRVRSMTGCDISPAMIRAAQQRAHDMTCRNAVFRCVDWASADVDALGFSGAFDLVFAHMTPAIADLASFEKMLRCTRRYGVLEACTRRSNPVLERVCALVGDAVTHTGQDEQIEHIFACLWQAGLSPHVTCRRETWCRKSSPEEAASWCLGRMALHRDIETEEAAAVRDCVRHMADGNQIDMPMAATIVTFTWDVTEHV